MNNKLISEERYHKSNQKIKLVAIIVLVVGLLLGGGLITVGIINSNNINKEYSNENKINVENELSNEKLIIERKISDLKEKGIVYDSFAKYTDGEKYDLKIMTNALDPSFDYCSFKEYVKNSLTSKYCSLRNKTEELDSDFNRSFDSYKVIPFFMFGGFIIIVALMISGSIFLITKRRSFLAYGVSQVLPIAEEGMEKIAPTISNVATKITKDMAPVYGEVAREISKGIKEGLKDEENK